MPRNPFKRHEVTPVRPANQTPQTPRYGVVVRGRKRKRPPKAAADRQPGFLARVANDWWNRLIGAVFGGTFSSETEQYLAHQTKRDYVCNTLGQAAWGMLFPLLTMVATWFVGAEQAGLFSMAFTVGTLLLFLANYGVRTYQVSDLDEMQTFLDYQVNRVITCALMLLVGWLWCQFRGYDGYMFSICMGVLVFRAVDGLADVYEGRLQQADKLYLAGLSQAARCVLGIGGIRRRPAGDTQPGVGELGARRGRRGVAAAAHPPARVLRDGAVAPGEPPRREGALRPVLPAVPRALPLQPHRLRAQVYDGGRAQLRQPALLQRHVLPRALHPHGGGFIYKPQLVRLARIWDDPEKHRRFDLLVLAMMGVIALITGGMALVMGTVGIPVMSFMYGIDFEQFRSLCLVMVATGGVCACIDFLYQIITVLRAQEQVSGLYLIAIAFAVPVSMLLVSFAGLAGAVVSSLVSMAILLVLLVTEYFAIRRRMAGGR